ncbi:MAG: SOS response-associated peptidase [Candidatus Latescibacteria bacterium]|jgi:putative SOS response-associated peptidase YedK|nr:SOS response-associated peptidase [Candidatus Latescibacterota bacterium]
MCGRFALASEAEKLRWAFPGFIFPDEIPPRYNVAPTQNVWAVLNDGTGRVCEVRWGLVPHWAKDPKIGSRMINARSETLHEKPAFRTAYRRRRCLIFADGFYEWRKDPGEKTKTPVYIRMASQTPFALAGLWERWEPGGDPPLLSCTIITTEPNPLLAEIHNRMPVILPPECHAEWLAPGEIPPDALSQLLKPFPASEMVAFPVSRQVNNPRVDTPACIEPTEPGAT